MDGGHGACRAESVGKSGARMMLLKNSPIEVTTKDEVPSRMAVLIWGPAGSGKTTLAATAPGKKLWLSLGDQEHVSIMHRTDVIVMGLYKYGYQDILKYGQNDNPFGLDQILADNEDIETVVFDSVTALTDAALRKAVDMKLGASRTFSPSMEHPGMSAYGGRNAIVLEVLSGLLRVTAKHGVHVIFTAHEADPEKDAEGVVQYITIMLGGKLVNNVTWRLSEIWYLSEDAKGRQLAVRPARKHRPMKTRMFTGKGEPEFILSYDSDKPDKGQMTIAAFYEQWLKTKGKLAIPKSRRD
jgi:AAA domain